MNLDLESGIAIPKPCYFASIRNLRFFPPEPVPYPRDSQGSKVQESKVIQKLGKLTPGKDISLEDVLNDLHDHPLSLASFESYLLSVRAVNNLYFIIWLRSYTRLYEEAQELNQKEYISLDHHDTKTLTDHEEMEESDQISINSISKSSFTEELEMNSPQLRVEETDSLQRRAYETGVNTFIVSSSPLQLNLAPKIKSSLLELVAAATPNNPLHPSAFTPARKVILKDLKSPFADYLKVVLGNVGTRSYTASRIVGGSLFFIGILPFLLSLALGMGHSVRYIGLPFLFFGSMVFITGLDRTCVLLYLTGRRRTFAYEFITNEKAGMAPSPTSIDANPKLYDFSASLRRYSAVTHIPPKKSHAFSHMLGPLVPVDASVKSLFYFKQNQIIWKALGCTIIILLIMTIIFSVVPT